VRSNPASEQCPGLETKLSSGACKGRLKFSEDIIIISKLNKRPSLGLAELELGGTPQLHFLKNRPQWSK
jgi:hypothetical protein